MQAGREHYGAGKAFRIDKEGVNRPLISESDPSDTYFQPGETWTFVIQDFVSGGPGGGAANLTSIGVAGGSLLGGDSSGSIIGVPVPEPTGLGLLVMGMVGPVMWGCRRDISVPGI